LLPWSEITRCYTTASLFIMAYGVGELIALPKRCCRLEEWREIVEWAGAARGFAQQS
jgi:YcxB-like protein